MLTPVLLCFMLSGPADADRIKSDAKDAGQQVGQAAKKVGKFFGKAGRKVGQAAKEGGKETGKAGKEFGHGVRDAVKEGK